MSTRDKIIKISELEAGVGVADITRRRHLCVPSTASLCISLPEILTHTQWRYPDATHYYDAAVAHSLKHLTKHVSSTQGGKSQSHLDRTMSLHDQHDIFALRPSPSTRLDCRQSPGHSAQLAGKRQRRLSTRAKMRMARIWSST